MSFLERLRDFLRHPVPLPDADLRYRQRFLAVLEQCEAQGALPDWLHNQQSRFGGRLELFTDALSAELLAQGITPADVPALVDAGIAQALGINEQAATRTRAMILSNAVHVALNSIQFNAPFRPGEDYGGWWNVSRYAREIQAVRQDRDRTTITAIGRMLLELAGREAVKWLLHVEVALSTGSNDPWRVDRWTLQILASCDPSKPLNTLRLILETGHAPSTASLERLAVLGLLQVNKLGALGALSAESRSDTLLEKANERSYSVLPHASSILGEFAEERDTPMSILVQALLEDEVRGLLPEEQAAPATTATIRQARLIVHEIGHTVTPVQVALESIARTARAAGIAGQIADPLRRANLALDRLRSFSNKLDELAQLAGEVPGVFDAETALHEAMRMGRPETGHVPATSLPKRLPHLLGVRERFVLALVNLLRNAYQAAPADTPTVAVTVELEQSRLHVMVDDNGPGVPPAERERIFLDGYSTRAGGSGRGLALSRAIIEKDMHGSLTCEDGSSMGGARFVIVVPIYEERTP